MQPLPRGSVSVLPVLSLPAILRERGTDPEQVFARAGVDFGRFGLRNQHITYRELGRLLEIAAASARCPHLGLLIAARCAMSSFGPVGALAGHAPDIGTAIGDFVKHMPKWDRAAVISLTVEGETATFSSRIDRADFHGARIIREGTVAIMVRVLRHFFGASWSPDLVLFSHKASGPEYPYRRYFAAPLHFGSGIAGIVFAKRWLDQRVSSADEALRETLMTQLSASDAADSVSFADRTRRQILLSLPFGLTGPHGVARAQRQPAVARALGMDVSTMRRRLAREATSFRQIAHDIHYETAKHLIRDSALALTEVASMLGYAELSVFTRAFRRWSGLTPSAWRERHSKHQSAP